MKQVVTEMKYATSFRFLIEKIIHWQPLSASVLDHNSNGKFVVHRIMPPPPTEGLRETY